jgi:hypothetical protein
MKATSAYGSIPPRVSRVTKQCGRRSRTRRPSVLMFLVFASYLGSVHAQINEPSEEIYIVRPSETNPSIEHFDEPHYVISSNSADAVPPPLVVFLAGTGGKPRNSAALLHTIAAQGYRVIGLEYNDVPAVVETCAKALTPTCSGSFRNSRIFGDYANSPVFTPPAETIVNRLCSLLLFLDREHPGTNGARI